MSHFLQLASAAASALCRRRTRRRPSVARVPVPPGLITEPWHWRPTGPH